MSRWRRVGPYLGRDVTRADGSRTTELFHRWLSAAFAYWMSDRSWETLCIGLFLPLFVLFGLLEVVIDAARRGR